VHSLDAGEETLKALLPANGESNAEARRVTIALSHFPSHAVALAHAGVDLVLAGHTHGGQVCLPGGIPLITHDVLPRRFARGAHRLAQTWLVTSRGCGFSKYPIRVFCPAEAIEIVLVSENSSMR
jgi:uncharacterized protein